MNSVFPRALSGALFTLFLCRHVQARAIYVAPGGARDPQGTLADPWGDVSRAVRFAGAGDSILIRGGVYDLKQSVYLDKPGLSLSNYHSEKVVLRAPNDEKSDVPHVLVINKSNVTVSGLDIRGGSYYGVKIDVDDEKRPARNVVVRNCRVGNTGRDCFKTFNADALLIENCDIGPSGLRDDSNAEGIDSIGSHGVTVRNCRVHDIATNGIYFKGGTTDGLIENCVIKNTKRAAGILLGQDTDEEFMRDGTPFEARRCVARGNIIINTAGSGVGTFAGDGIRFENNTLINVARETGAGVWVGVNRRKVRARSVVFKNNVVSLSGARPFAYLLELSDSFAAQNNLYYAGGKSGYFRIERAGEVRTLPLAAWRAATRSDSASRIGNPLLDGKFKPRVGSPARGKSGRAAIGARK